MHDMILLKLGEIVLKGLNRRSFEMKLLANVNRRLRPFGKFHVCCMQSIIYIEPANDECDVDGAFEAMHYVFGVVSLSRAAGCEKNLDAVVETAKTYLRPAMLAAKSFKVESKRADKTFPKTSIQVSQYVGGELQDAFPQILVDVHQPELTVHVEIREKAAYVYAAPEPGAGGLPIGSGGKAVTLLSGGIDSPVSTYMIAKRGIQVLPVHFFSFPYTSMQAREKVLELGQLLQKYCGDLNVDIVPFTHIQEEIRAHCPEEYFTLIMRRFMMRIAEQIAKNGGAKALITGENLGQVASQTMEALAVTEAPLSLPVLRPLIGMDKEDIVTLARKIGTFDTSILPYEDCCTVFTPRHPKTRPHLADVVEAESVLDVEGLIQEALSGTERICLNQYFAAQEV